MPKRNSIPPNLGRISRARIVSGSMSYMSPAILRGQIAHHVSQIISGHIEKGWKQVRLARYFKQKNPAVRTAVVNAMLSSINDLANKITSSDTTNLPQILAELSKNIKNNQDNFKSINEMVNYVKTFIKEKVNDPKLVKAVESNIISVFKSKLVALIDVNNGSAILDPIGNKGYHIDRNGDFGTFDLPVNTDKMMETLKKYRVLPSNDPVEYARIVDKIIEYRAITMHKTPGEAVYFYERSITELLGKDQVFRKGYKILLEKEVNSLFNHTLMANTIFHTITQLPVHLVAMLSRVFGALVGVLPLARELGAAYGQVGADVALVGGQITQLVEGSSTMWNSPHIAFSQLQSEAMNESILANEQAKWAYTMSRQASGMHGFQSGGFDKLNSQGPSVQP